ncbi:hypothetical protein GF340_01645 [Candidatus Peregrinibacteria bacterium]|nr:hypothetical protein [Candidatus Peregrinibacteria bacterium]
MSNINKKTPEEITSCKRENAPRIKSILKKVHAGTLAVSVAVNSLLAISCGDTTSDPRDKITMTGGEGGSAGEIGQGGTAGMDEKATAGQGGEGGSEVDEGSMGPEVDEGSMGPEVDEGSMGPEPQGSLGPDGQ